MELLIEVLGFVGCSRFYGVVGYHNPSWNHVMSCFHNRSSNHWFPENACEAFRLIFRKMHTNHSDYSFEFLPEWLHQDFRFKHFFFSFLSSSFFLDSNCFNEWKLPINQWHCYCKSMPFCSTLTCEGTLQIERFFHWSMSLAYERALFLTSSLILSVHFIYNYTYA